MCLNKTLTLILTLIT